MVVCRLERAVCGEQLETDPVWRGENKEQSAHDQSWMEDFRQQLREDVRLELQKFAENSSAQLTRIEQWIESHGRSQSSNHTMQTHQSSLKGSEQIKLKNLAASIDMSGDRNRSEKCLDIITSSTDQNRAANDKKAQSQNVPAGGSPNASPKMKVSSSKLCSNPSEGRMATGTTTVGKSAEVKEQHVFDLHRAQGAFKKANKASTSSIKEPEPSRNPINLNQMIASDNFEYCIGVAILINSIVIGAQVEWTANHENESPPAIFQVLEVFFCMLFAAELGLRIAVQKMNFILSSSWRWNVFDAVIVGFALIDTFMMLSTDAEEGGNSVAAMRVLRIIRLFRAIRMIRVVRFFKDLRIMLLSIMNSFKTLFWALLLIGIILYVIGIFITQVVLEHVQGHADDDNEELMTYYGNLGTTMISLFKAISGGADWGDLADPLILHISGMFAPVFVLYISFALFAVLNVVTGVFVESALASAQEDKDLVIQEEIAKRDSYVHEVRDLFKEADQDGSGELSWPELEKHLHDPRVQAYFKALELDASEARGLFNLLDTDDTGTVSSDEFVMGCMRLKGQAKSIDVATLMYENKRMASKWNGFMQFVEQSFDRLDSFVSASSNNFRPLPREPTIRAEDMEINVQDWEHVFLEDTIPSNDPEPGDANE
eukprot:gnl/MRDRNA2_/MRDRNA2_85082_c0_seq1.p1 gnl/MRDRNA2_/MRDRNA2_85082_c0~~gnl/MRDRNA2_/MRDRNA2_85082_c0_seq1.p1  ORF type:complete len:657 (-),score=123.71 gnl/MRDRNA2_/MRDRNA2_85082_c0_seq1:18-1988(-)